MALFNHFLKFRQESMRSFSCMANHAGKAGARVLGPKLQNPCTRITQRMPESLGSQGFLRYSVRINKNLNGPALHSYFPSGIPSNPLWHKKNRTGGGNLRWPFDDPTGSIWETLTAILQCALWFHESEHESDENPNSKAIVRLCPPYQAFPLKLFPHRQPGRKAGKGLLIP